MPLARTLAPPSSGRSPSTRAFPRPPPATHPSRASQANYPCMQLTDLRAAHKRAPEEDATAGAAKRGRASDEAGSSLQDASFIAEEVARGTEPGRSQTRTESQPKKNQVAKAPRLDMKPPKA